MEKLMRADAQEIGIHFLFHQLIAGAQAYYIAIQVLYPMVKFKYRKLIEEMVFLYRQFAVHIQLGIAKPDKIALNSFPVRLGLTLHPEVKLEPLRLIFLVH